MRAALSRGETAVPGRADPIPAGDALRRAHALAPRPAAEWVPLERLRGRRLAAAVFARRDLPSADCSAMDGWALRAADAAGPLRVRGESAAGHAPLRAIAPGEACRISTGAVMPAGADAVLRREDGDEAGGFLVPATALRPGADVRPLGDDLTAGQEILAAGHPVAAHEVAVVAAAGHAGAFCRRAVRVAIATTGDELVAPGAPVPRGGVVDTNLIGLTAQAEAAGALVCASAHAPDDHDATLAAFSGLLDESPDVLITVGGISVGAHDHVGPALERLGARWELRGVAMRPGHPVGVAVCGPTVVLAIPGNPAAAAVSFHLLGRPLLGAPDDWLRSLPLQRPVPRHERATTFLRCTEEAQYLVPLDRQGSAQLSSLARATALAWIEPGAGSVVAGSAIPVSRMP